jgi:hypothetical protein
MGGNEKGVFYMHIEEKRPVHATEQGAKRERGTPPELNSAQPIICLRHTKARFTYPLLRGIKKCLQILDSSLMRAGL